MVIIGIGGLVRSGKDTLAELLMENGFYGFSFGDYVRERARQRHQGKEDPLSLANLTETSNWLRETHGSDVVLKAALNRFKEVNKNNDYKGVVLFSVRAPVEVDFILNNGGELIWVEASAAIRHERGKNALRDGEKEVSLEEFIRQESLQWKPQPGIPEEVQMNVEYVKGKATIVINNNQNDIEAFRQQVREKLADYL